MPRLSSIYRDQDRAYRADTCEAVKQAVSAGSIEQMNSIEPADALKMETDLSIRYEKPREPDLIAVRVATFHYVPWASPDYLNRHGVPSSPEDLLQHTLLDHFAYQGGDGDWSDWFALARAANLITYRTNSSAALRVKSTSAFFVNRYGKQPFSFPPTRRSARLTTAPAPALPSPRAAMRRANSRVSDMGANRLTWNSSFTEESVEFSRHSLLKTEALLTRMST